MPAFLANSTRTHLPPISTRSSGPLDLAFSDMWSPSPITSTNGYKYFVLFADDYSKFTWLVPISRKYEVVDVYFVFQNFVEHQFNCKLKSLQSDWEGEYKYGIAHRISCPHTHEKNGSTERKIRHTLKRVSLLAHASIPRHFWHFAFETTVFLINRLPSPVLKDKSPFVILLKPIFAYHSIHCVFLWYSPNHHGYRHLDRHSDCLYAHHVRFDEYYFPFKNTSILGPSPVNSPKITWLVVPVTCSSQNMLSSSSQNHVSIIISKSMLAINPLPVHPPYHLSCLIPQQAKHPSHHNHIQLHLLSIIHLSIPQWSRLNQEVPHLLLAMLVPILIRWSCGWETRWTIINWLFSVVQKLSWQLDTLSLLLLFHRVCLFESQHASPKQIKFRNGGQLCMQKFQYFFPMAPGLQYHALPPWMSSVASGILLEVQTRWQHWWLQGMPCCEGFHSTKSRLDRQLRPVIKSTTIHTVLAITISNNWPICHLEVSNAFLHGHLSKDVYLFQPPGILDESWTCMQGSKIFVRSQASAASYGSAASAPSSLCWDR